MTSRIALSAPANSSYPEPHRRVLRPSQDARRPAPANPRGIPPRCGRPAGRAHARRSRPRRATDACRRGILSRRQHAAALLAQALLIFDPAQLLGRTYRRLAVGTHAQPAVHAEKARCAEKAVAQVCLGADRHADGRIGLRRCRAAPRRPHGLHAPRTNAASAAPDQQQFDGPAAGRAPRRRAPRASAPRRGCAPACPRRCSRSACAALAQVPERHRAQTVECGPGAQQRIACAALIADALFDGAQELLGVQEKSRLLRLQRPAAEVAALIERRQERQADAGGAWPPE